MVKNKIKIIGELKVRFKGGSNDHIMSLGYYPKKKRYYLKTDVGSFCYRLTNEQVKNLEAGEVVETKINRVQIIYIQILKYPQPDFS